MCESSSSLLYLNKIRCRDILEKYSLASCDVEVPKPKKMLRKNYIYKQNKILYCFNEYKIKYKHE